MVFGQVRAMGQLLCSWILGGPDLFRFAPDSVFRTLVSPCTIRKILCAISSGERTKSMHPVAIALSGISGCLAVSSFCAMVTPPASFMPHSAVAPSPSYPETMTAMSLPLQCCVRERRKTVMTSGHPSALKWALDETHRRGCGDRTATG